MDRFEDLSDAELLGLSCSRPEAFGVLYRRYERPILIYLRRRSASAEIAADLCAEVFASALASAGRYRADRAPVVAWLYAIAHHTLSVSYRRGRVADRARRRLQMEPLTLTDESLERVEAITDAGRAADHLHMLLEQLPRDQRDAVLARIVDERPYEEIANELECSTAVVRQRVSRGLAALKTAYEKDLR
jgi:RNA polymerase sigma factor (sigma-70 family)